MNRHLPCLEAAVLAALTGCSAGTPGAAAVAQTAAVPELGARIYNGNCSACHQQSGLGVPGVYPSLAGSPVVLGDVGDLARWVTAGRRPAARKAPSSSAAMPRFGWLSGTDATALFSYLRTSFGNHAGPADEAQVTRALSE